MDDFERWRHEVDRRLDALESAKSKVRKPVDTAGAKAINLRNMESSVSDGEMFRFNGKYFWSENKGKFTKIAFSPLDAGRDEKCGKFFTTFEALPTWLQKGQAVEVVAQCKAKPPYMNYNVVSMKPMGAANSPQYAEPAMQYNAPLDDMPPRTPQTFVSDEEAGVDPSNIPF